MRSPRPASFLFVAGSLAGLLPATAASAAQTAPPDETPLIQPDEFHVTSERETTYRATNATAGTRLGTRIKDPVYNNPRGASSQIALGAPRNWMFSSGCNF